MEPENQPPDANSDNQIKNDQTPVNCPRCSTLIPVGKSICPNCGTAIPLQAVWPPQVKGGDWYQSAPDKPVESLAEGCTTGCLTTLFGIVVGAIFYVSGLTMRLFSIAVLIISFGILIGSQVYMTVHITKTKEPRGRIFIGFLVSIGISWLLLLGILAVCYSAPL